MCELLGLSSRLPTTARQSLSVFAQHRGSAEGWGVAFYDQRDVRLYKEPEAAAESDWLTLVRARQLPGSLMLAHIRHATQGRVSLANTQPFTRELAGRIHVFAHNGRLDGIEDRHAGAWSRFAPIGETDSEVAFCILLERMAPLWQAGVPTVDARLAAFAAFCASMRMMGPANFLYSDGDALFAHSDRRMQAGGTIAPPGLWRLSRRCDRDGSAPADGRNAGAQEVMLFASVPVSGDLWISLEEGEALAVRHGRLLGRVGPEVAAAQGTNMPFAAAAKS